MGPRKSRKGTEKKALEALHPLPPGEWEKSWEGFVFRAFVDAYFHFRDFILLSAASATCAPTGFQRHTGCPTTFKRI
jgi:hypothetical protein